MRLVILKQYISLKHTKKSIINHNKKILYFFLLVTDNVDIEADITDHDKEEEEDNLVTIADEKDGLDIADPLVNQKVSQVWSNDTLLYIVGKICIRINKTNDITDKDNGRLEG